MYKKPKQFPFRNKYSDILFLPYLRTRNKREQEHEMANLNEWYY